MLPGTFGVFETFRILIPGYFSALCATWYLQIFLPGVTGSVQSAQLAGITFVGFGLAVGLVLYLNNLPKDSKAYRELLPSAYICKRARELGKPIELKEAAEVFFYLLNNYLSDPLRERVFYYGNIYRVAQKTWLLSLIFVTLSIGTQVYFCLRGWRVPHPTAAITFETTLLILFLSLKWRAEKHAMDILKGQIHWLQRRDKLLQSLLTNDTDPNVTP